MKEKGIFHFFLFGRIFFFFHFFFIYKLLILWRCFFVGSFFLGVRYFFSFIIFTIFLAVFFNLEVFSIFLVFFSGFWRFFGTFFCITFFCIFFCAIFLGLFSEWISELHYKFCLANVSKRILICHLSSFLQILKTFVTKIKKGISFALTLLIANIGRGRKSKK